MNVEQWIKIEMLKKDKELTTFDFNLQRLSILLNKPVSILEQLKLETYSYLVNKHKEPIYKVNKCFVLGFKVFKPIHDLSEFTVAHDKDLQELIKQAGGNYEPVVADLLALTHKELTWTGFKYVQNNHYKNVILFKKAKAKKVIGNIFFYSVASKNLEKDLKTYSELITAHVKEMESDKEFQDFLKGGGLNIQ